MISLIMRAKPPIFLTVLSVFVLALGCSDDGGNGLSQYEPCPEDRIESAKSFLVLGDGDAARAAFLSILEEFPDCVDAHFGVVLSDQLRLMGILDELITYLIDVPGEGEPIDIGAIVSDYAENLMEPVVGEMLDHLDPCNVADSFRFDLERLPFEFLGLEFLVYAGEYDMGDVLFQSAEFNLIAAMLNTILSVDLDFDSQIFIDHMESWPGMSIFSTTKDVVDMILEILFDPQYPTFLRLRDEGYQRMPRAGLQMGYAFEFLNRAVGEIRAETRDQGHDVTGCGDRNHNGLCDPDEFIKGIFYSLPSDLHEELQKVELALRDSYWDGTELDIAPDAPNPFTIDQLNPILQYFGMPPLIPALPIDFGAMYAQSDPNQIRRPFAIIFILVRLILELIPGEDGGWIRAGTPEADSGTCETLFHDDGIPQGPPGVGVETATDIAALPYLTPTARTLQISSHDPTGGNIDGYIPPNHLYIDEHGEFVAFDAYGPGCIYRFQFTHTWSIIGNLRIYVDDMETPVIEGPYWLLFFSAFEPFTRPLIGNFFSASGTNFSYLPIPFEKRCRITVNVPPEYYSITYVRYDADTPVASYTGYEDTSLMRSQFSHVGCDPKPEVPSHIESGAVEVGPDASEVLVEIDSGGAVWRLFLDPEPFSQEAVNNLWLKAYWDDNRTPAVEAPISEFFGSLYIEDAPKSLMIGHDGERFYSYFPMPFWTGALLEVENRGQVPVHIEYEIQVAEDTYAPGAGYFKAVYNEENPVEVGRDYHIAFREGAAGKWVGLTHTMRGPSQWYLEGDERFYVDGSLSPALYGTGTEDYYNGGWYFLMGTFTEPLSGNPLYRSLPGYELTGAYRLHLFDAVHYLDRIRLGIEHGSDNSESSNHYSSVSYFYELDASILLLTDTLDVGDQANESAHDYRAVDSELTGEITSFYEGEDDEVAVTDSGRIVHGESRFRVSVDPLNSGVILRRRYDQHHPRQQARVLVGGVDAGTWYTPESNETLRWAESDFVLPPSLTSGLSNLEILIRSEGASDWTGFYYWVYSIVQ